MANLKSVLGYGFLTWLVPFLTATPLVSPDGVPRIDIFLFKKIMLLVGTATGTYLLVRLLGREQSDAFSAGVKVGFAWLVINLGLDAVILLPISGMGAREYMQSIGLTYFTIPMIAAGMGLAIQRSHETAGRA